MAGSESGDGEAESPSGAKPSGAKQDEGSSELVKQIDGLRAYIAELGLSKHTTARINVGLSIVTVIFTLITGVISGWTKMTADNISKEVSIYHEVTSTRQFDRGLMISLFEKASALTKEKNPESIQVFSTMIGSFVSSYDTNDPANPDGSQDPLESSVKRDQQIMRNYVVSINALLQNSGVANDATKNGSVELQARFEGVSDTGSAPTGAQAKPSIQTVTGDPHGWDYDVFWCSSADNAKDAQTQKQAKQIFDILIGLKDQDHLGRLRLKPLGADVNNRSGYKVAAYAIRRHISKDAQAQLLKQELDGKLGQGVTFSIEDSAQIFPFYLSVFVCPT